jgi:hypothetical protein
MSNTRKPGSGDPRKHPGSDELVVITPDPDCLPPAGTDVDEWVKDHPPKSRVDHVTRDEFVRRMAGSPVLDTLHASGRRTRVIMFMEPDAIMQWWDTA